MHYILIAFILIFMTSSNPDQMSANLPSSEDIPLAKIQLRRVTISHIEGRTQTLDFEKLKELFSELPFEDQDQWISTYLENFASLKDKSKLLEMFHDFKLIIKVYLSLSRKEEEISVLNFNQFIQTRMKSEEDHIKYALAVKDVFSKNTAVFDRNILKEFLFPGMAPDAIAIVILAAVENIFIYELTLTDIFEIVLLNKEENNTIR